MSELRLPWEIIQRASKLAENEETVISTTHDGKTVNMTVARRDGVLTAVTNDPKKQGKKLTKKLMVALERIDEGAIKTGNRTSQKRIPDFSKVKTAAKGGAQTEPCQSRAETRFSGQRPTRGRKTARHVEGQNGKGQLVKPDKKGKKPVGMTRATASADCGDVGEVAQTKSSPVKIKQETDASSNDCEASSVNGPSDHGIKLDADAVSVTPAKRQRRMTDKYKQLLEDLQERQHKQKNNKAATPCTPKPTPKAKERKKDSPGSAPSSPAPKQEAVDSDDAVLSSGYLAALLPEEEEGVMDMISSHNDHVGSPTSAAPSQQGVQTQAAADATEACMSDAEVKVEEDSKPLFMEEDEKLSKKPTKPLKNVIGTVTKRRYSKRKAVESANEEDNKIDKLPDSENTVCKRKSTKRKTSETGNAENEAKFVDHDSADQDDDEDGERSPVKLQRKQKRNLIPNKRTRNKLLSSAYYITEDGQRKCMYCQKLVTGGSIWHHIYKWCRSSPLRLEKTYTCRKCCETFSFFEDLQQHQAWHEEQKRKKIPNVCGVCSQERCKRRDAPVKVQLGTKTFACKVCEAVFPNNDLLGEHQRIHPELYRFQCEFCGKSYKCKRDMDSHRQIKHLNPFRYNCVQCGLGLRNAADLESHKCISMENPVSTVKQAFSKRYAVNTHLLNDEQEKLEIEQSDMPLSLEEAKDRDRQLPHPASLALSPRTQPDTECGVDEGDKAKVEKRYVCEFCGHRCLTAAGRYKHLTRKHGYRRFGVARKKGWCQICDKHFSSTYYLNHHIKSMHLQEKAYECDVCHKRFHLIKDCEYHKKTLHEGKFRYYCSKCGKGVHSKARSLAHHCNWGQASRDKAERRARKAQLRARVQQNVKTVGLEVQPIKYQKPAIRVLHKPLGLSVLQAAVAHVGAGLDTVEVQDATETVVLETEPKSDPQGTFYPQTEAVLTVTSSDAAAAAAAGFEVGDVEECSTSQDVDYTTIEIDKSEAILVENETEGEVRYMVAYFDDSGNLVVQPTSVESSQEFEVETASS